MIWLRYQADLRRLNHETNGAIRRSHVSTDGGGPIARLPLAQASDYAASHLPCEFNRIRSYNELLLLILRAPLPLSAWAAPPLVRASGAARDSRHSIARLASESRGLMSRPLTAMQKLRPSSANLREVSDTNCKYVQRWDPRLHGHPSRCVRQNRSCVLLSMHFQCFENT